MGERLSVPRAFDATAFGDSVSDRALQLRCVTCDYCGTAASISSATVETLLPSFEELGTKVVVFSAANL